MSTKVKTEERKVYVTTDGKVFDESELAERHQTVLDYDASVTDFLADSQPDKTDKYRVTLKNVILQWEAYKAGL